MTEYITKEQAIDVIDTAFGHIYDSDSATVSLIDLQIEIIMTIEQHTEPADVAPVVHSTTSGEYWDETYCKWKTCDNCRGENVFAADYCNWCGARLDGEEE